jgi:hypothetical protein
MSVQKINPIQDFTDSIFSNGKEKELFRCFMILFVAILRLDKFLLLLLVFFKKG